jgi:hypothetical protein
MMIELRSGRPVPELKARNRDVIEYHCIQAGVKAHWFIASGGLPPVGVKLTTRLHPMTM